MTATAHSDAVRLAAALNADPEMQRALNAPAPACSDGAAGASAGVPYTLAGVAVPPPSPCHLWALALIHSPLLTGPESIEAADAWRALWAMTCNPDDLAPLMGLDGAVEHMRRIGAAWQLADDALASAAATVTRSAWAAIDSAVSDMAARYPGATANDAAELVITMLRDWRDAWGRVPRTGGGGRDSQRPFPATGSECRANTRDCAASGRTFGTFQQHE